MSDVRTHRLLEDIKFILGVLVEELTTVRIVEETVYPDLHTVTTVIGKESQKPVTIRQLLEGDKNDDQGR